MDSVQMSVIPGEVKWVERPEFVQMSGYDLAFAQAIEHELPAHIEWMPQTMKFKFPLNEDKNLVYRPNFIFRDPKVGGLVAFVLEPDWISLGNLYGMKMIGSACANLSLGFVLMVDQSRRSEARVLRQLQEYEIPYTVIERPADFVNFVVEYFRKRRSA